MAYPYFTCSHRKTPACSGQTFRFFTKSNRIRMIRTISRIFLGICPGNGQAGGLPDFRQSGKYTVDFSRFYVYITHRTDNHYHRSFFSKCQVQTWNGHRLHAFCSFMVCLSMPVASLPWQVRMQLDFSIPLRPPMSAKPRRWIIACRLLLRRRVRNPTQYRPPSADCEACVDDCKRWNFPGLLRKHLRGHGHLRPGSLPPL